MRNKYLNIEEQFKETLNVEEINRIQDPELRKMRYDHWKYRTNIFRDEHNISDTELCRLTNIDYGQERKEIEEYRKRKGIQK